MKQSSTADRTVNQADRQKLAMVDAACLGKWGQRWANQYDFEDKATRGAWAIALRDLSIEQVTNGLHQLVKLDEPHPSEPGRVASICRDVSRQGARQARLEAPDPEVEIDRSPKGRARRACKAALTVKLCGMQVSGNYAGEFPVDKFVNALDVDLAEHNAVRRQPLRAGQTALDHPILSFEERLFARMDQEFETWWSELEGRA